MSTHPLQEIAEYQQHAKNRLKQEEEKRKREYMEKHQEMMKKDAAREAERARQIAAAETKLSSPGFFQDMAFCLEKFAPWCLNFSHWGVPKLCPNTGRFQSMNYRSGYSDHPSYNKEPWTHWYSEPLNKDEIEAAHAKGWMVFNHKLYLGDFLWMNIHPEETESQRLARRAKWLKALNDIAEANRREREEAWRDSCSRMDPDTDYTK